MARLTQPGHFLARAEKAASSPQPLYYTDRTMKIKKLVKEAAEIAEPLRIANGKDFRLKDYDPADTYGMKDKEKALKALERGVKLISHLQEKLYAQDQWAVLLIFQAMDAAGKDGAIKHVMSGINPEGCEVTSFKAPSHEELDHDFLWRTHKVTPRRGIIGIFNRSYYEEVLVVRVHQELLKAEHLPDKLVGKDIWDQRYDDINNFESYLSHNGIVILKFFLHLSKEEQKKRFLERLEMPEKNWKFSMDDVKERQYWDDYQKAYEKMIQNTATKQVPWYVVPADNKWFTRLAVASATIEALDSLHLQFPEVDKEKKKELEAVRGALIRAKD
jgi:PPK2 family polyphosphate:nucleotide phosphotransferase